MKDLRQTDRYANYLGSLGWGVDRIGEVYLYTKKIPLLGSVLKIQRPEEVITNRDFKRLVRKKKVIFAQIEPKTNRQLGYFKKHLGFNRQGSPSLPSKTVQIDLTLPEEKLLSAMHHKTRYNIGLSKRRGVKVKFSQNIHTFTEFWQKQARKRGMFIPQKNEIKKIFQAFGKRSQILLAYKENGLLGGILLIRGDKVSYYMYAASSPEGKKDFAPTLLVWESIRYAKNCGDEWFDLEGIYDPRFPLGRWKGFSRFKRSFGGREIEYPRPASKITLFRN